MDTLTSAEELIHRGHEALQTQTLPEVSHEVLQTQTLPKGTVKDAVQDVEEDHLDIDSARQILEQPKSKEKVQRR